MTSADTDLPKRVTLKLRIKADERRLIDRAATSQGKSRTEFILETARIAAKEAILDQAVISVTPEAYQAFLEQLDSPPTPNERLRKTLQAPAPRNTE
jgi:uncharacterized protein (DUF1778 family)